MKKVFVILAGVLFAIFGFVKVASAGPIIIDGTDTNDHGQAVKGVNTEGWKYMQLVLEHLSEEVYTDTARVVVDLGATQTSCPNDTHSAREAINSAFNLSSLPSQGWTLIHVDTAVSITNWLQNLSTENTGILYIPTYNNLCGDLQSSEVDAINANAAALVSFINGPGNPGQGGALFAQSERNVTQCSMEESTSSTTPNSTGCSSSTAQSNNAFLWLPTLIPGLSAAGFSEGYDSWLHLTADGRAIFPSLTNADISAGPWHNWFKGDFGGLSILATASERYCLDRAVIIGGNRDTVVGPEAGQLSATKAGSLLTDADEDGAISPGDTLQYLVRIHNASGQVVTDVVYTDTPDPNTSLVVGSVQATTGTVTLGNNPGDATVRVDIGSIYNGQTVSIQYDTVIADPFPEGVYTVTNQGLVTTGTGTVIPTNDPSHTGPTVITVTQKLLDGNVTLELTAASSVQQCVLPGSSYYVTWTVANTGDVVFPGGSIDTLITGSGSGPLSTAIPAIPTGTVGTITETILVSAPVAYGEEVVTVTGSILTSTAVLTTQICAPDFRTSIAHAVGAPIFIGEEFTYTWQISNTGNAAAPGVTAVLTLPIDVLFSYDDNLTSTIGLAGYAPLSNTVTWTGDLAVGESAAIIFNARTGFGFPHGLIEAPFEVDHPYRPPFVSAATYTYPYKLFFMLVLKEASASPAAR